MLFDEMMRSQPHEPNSGYNYTLSRRFMSQLKIAFSHSVNQNCSRNSGANHDQL